MAGESDEMLAYNQLSTNKLANKASLLELSVKIKDYVDQNSGSGSGSSIRAINYSNLSDTTSDDYIFLNNAVGTYSDYTIDWQNYDFRLVSIFGITYLPVSVITENSQFAGFRMIGTSKDDQISIRKLLYSNGTWTMLGATFVQNLTAGTGIDITNGVISVNLANASQEAM